MALLNPASTNNELTAMRVAYPDVKKPIPKMDGRTPSVYLFATLSDTLRSPCNDAVYNHKLAYVHSTDPASQATQLPALDATPTTLFDATISDFDPLFQLDTVLATQA
ncbi:hypothetical protein BJY52DRAFT_1194150 [Lactarius psammicola]|nr:hypothetical protein BJY52DRAFT_1194150 [Lactarius psammicola]